MFMTMEAIKMKHFFNQHKLDSLSDAVQKSLDGVQKNKQQKKNARQQQEKLKQSRDRNVVRKKMCTRAISS